MADISQEYIDSVAADLKDRPELDMYAVTDYLYKSKDTVALDKVLNVVAIAARLKERYDNDDHPLPHCDWCGSWMHFSPTGQVVHENDCVWLALQKSIVALQEGVSK